MIKGFFLSTIGSSGELMLSFNITHTGTNPFVLILFKESVVWGNRIWKQEVKGDSVSIETSVPSEILNSIPNDTSLILSLYNFGAASTKYNSFSVSSGEIISNLNQTKRQTTRANATALLTFTKQQLLKKSHLVTVISDFDGDLNFSRWSNVYTAFPVSPFVNSRSSLIEVNGRLVLLSVFNGAGNIHVCNGNPSITSNWSEVTIQSFNFQNFINLKTKVHGTNAINSGILLIPTTTVYSSNFYEYDGVNPIITRSVTFTFPDAIENTTQRRFVMVGFLINHSLEFKAYIELQDRQNSTTLQTKYYLYTGVLGTSVSNWTETSIKYNNQASLSNGKFFAYKISNSSFIDRKAVVLDSSLNEEFEFNFTPSTTETCITHENIAYSYNEAFSSATRVSSLGCGDDKSINILNVNMGRSPSVSNPNTNIGYSPSENKLFISSSEGFLERTPLLIDRKINTSGQTLLEYDAVIEPFEKDTDFDTALNLSGMNTSVRGSLSSIVEYEGYLVVNAILQNGTGNKIYVRPIIT